MTRQAPLVMLVLVALIAVEAWYPFDLRRPQWTRTLPSRSGGVVGFDGSSVLKSRGPQDWVDRARRSGRLRIRLELRAGSAQQTGPARVLTVSRGYGASNVTVGQSGGDLIVRLRRPGSTPAGLPELRVGGLLADGAWHRLTLAVEAGRLTIDADGRPAVDMPLRPRPLARWDPSYTVALGDEPRGERGWRGDLRRADAVAGGSSVDLLAPGVLAPGRGLIPARTQLLWQAVPDESPARSLARLLPFALLAALAQRRWRCTRWTLAGVALLAVVLYAGKIFVDGRHATLSDILLSLVGGLVGSLLVSRPVRRRLRGLPDRR